MKAILADRSQFQFNYRMAAGKTQDLHPRGLCCVNPGQRVLDDDAA
jgi:hypothetical protein